MERSKLKVYKVRCIANTLKKGQREVFEYVKQSVTATPSMIANEAIAKAKRSRRLKDEFLFEVWVFEINELPAGKIKNGTKIKPRYRLLKEVQLIPPRGKEKKWTVLR